MQRVGRQVVNGSDEKVEQTMNITVNRPVEVTVTHVHVVLPVRFGEEDIPNDFPLRTGDTWTATINVDTGQIEEWPKGKDGHLKMKVCDQGVYVLKNIDVEVASIDQDYVPNDLIPGSYGDYVDLKIDKEGRITNWPKNPDVSEFFRDSEEAN